MKNHQKIVKNQQKRLKTAQKVFLPAFRCVQHPKAGQNTQYLLVNKIVLMHFGSRPGLLRWNKMLKCLSIFNLLNHIGLIMILLKNFGPAGKFFSPVNGTSPVPAVEKCWSRRAKTLVSNGPDHWKTNKMAAILLLDQWKTKLQNVLYYHVRYSSPQCTSRYSGL